MNIGLDFGTTNSIVSYWDTDNNKPTVFSFNNNTYTPSIVVWDMNLDEVCEIGRGGRDLWDNRPERYQLFQSFKILLSSGNQEEWKKRSWDGKQSPFDISKEFIKKLLIESSNSFTKNIGNINNLVVSVPELWQKEANNIGAYNLQKIVRELGLPLQQLVSEPLSAVAYYIWKSQIPEGITRKILVCDMGGGTFDVSWCKATKDTIAVESFEGSDNNRAGVYHLRKIIENALTRQNKKVNSYEFESLVWRMEKWIRMDRHQEFLERAFIDFATDPRRYDIEMDVIKGLPIYAGDIFHAFEEVQNSILQVLNKLDTRIRGLNAFDQLLLVGGFSEYFLVRRTILDYFNMNEKDSKIGIVSKQDSYLAISYGATLLAANQVKIIERYPHSIIYKSRYSNDEPINLQILKAGREISKNTKVFYPKKVKLLHTRFELEGYILLYGNHNDRIKFKKKIKLSEVNLSEDKEYDVGIEINESNIATFILRDSNGKIYRCEMQKMFEDEVTTLSRT